MRRNLLEIFLEKRSRKKGQLEIGITMMVLLVFLVLLIISLLVYFQFTASNIKETRQELLDKKFSTLVNSITNLPELKCSVRGAERECLNVNKLIAFANVLEDNNNIRGDYFDEFGINELSVDIVYPVSSGRDCEAPIPIGANCKKFTLMSFSDVGLKYTTPISVYYPEENVHRIGKLVVTAEM